MHPLAIAYEWTERNGAARGNRPGARRPGIPVRLARWVLRRVHLPGRKRVAPALAEVTEVPRPVLPAGPS